MKILSHFNDNYKLEERKLSSQRREMAKAYKKSSSFIEASKNPVTNLINGLLKSDNDDSPKHLIKTNLNSELGLAELEVASASDFRNDESDTNRFHFLKDDHLIHSYEFNKFNPIKNIYDYNIKKTEKFIPEKTFRTDLEDALINKKFQKAISAYKYHMVLAEKGYMTEQSKYTITA